MQLSIESEKQQSCDEPGGGGRKAPHFACQWALKDGSVQHSQ
jgi:hypothetical protein